jgi:DNA repair protein RadC
LTAALRREAWAPGNPALETQRLAVMTTLYVRDVSGFREAPPTDVLDRAQALLAQRYRVGSPVLSSPALTREFLKVHIGASEHEIFGVLHVDSRHRLIAVEDLFRGTINSASVHPREVVKAALMHNAAAVVLYHNHPSGLPEPSAADELITRRLKEALALIDVRVLDHLIVAESIYSMAEHGLL